MLNVLKYFFVLFFVFDNPRMNFVFYLSGFFIFRCSDGDGGEGESMDLSVVCSHPDLEQFTFMNRVKSS